MSKYPKSISVDAFNYELPDKQIAKYPLENRDDSKLLIYRDNSISETSFNSISKVIPKGSLLVFNNTKVIMARIGMQKSSGAKIEIFCLEPHTPAAYEESFGSINSCTWKCIVGNSKKWKDEVLEKTIRIENNAIHFKAQRIDKGTSYQIIAFSWDGNISFSELLENLGQIPIPPYLNRDSESIDSTRYQTVYSKHKGSVAAPTAGLHFTTNTLDELKSEGNTTAELTLHVGAGTFKPVQTDTIGEHEMHTEFFTVYKDTLMLLLQNKDCIIPVGTTSLRTLESLFWLGVHLINTNEIPQKIAQWEVYETCNISLEQSFSAILGYMEINNLDSINSSTQIIIAPGYRFRVISALITNFHQPQSTLLLLVSALIGNDWTKVYDYALQNNFRFLSYGDSSILFPAGSTVM